MAVPTRWLWLVALALAGCADAGGATDAGGDPDGYAPGTDPHVVLGTGGSAFVDIPPSGATLELVHGPQGGWHLEVSARLYGLTIDGLLLGYRTERDGTVVSMPTEYTLERFRVVPEGDHYLRAGDRVIFDIADGSEVVGATVDVIVTATPTDGDPVTDRRTVTVVDEIE